MKGWLYFLLVFLLPSCAPKIAPLVPFDSEYQQYVLEQFNDFRKQQCPGSVDSDVILQMDILGNDVTASGILMAQEPGNIHLRITDPLGRTMMMLVSDGASFTFTDNRKGEGYLGTPYSKSWAEYVPAGVEPKDLFSWLSGRLPGGEFNITATGRGPEDSCCWFVLDYNDASRQHHLKFDPQTGKVGRHFLAEAGNMIFDVSYLYPSGSGEEEQCRFPQALQLESSSISGTVQLEFKKIYSHGAIGADKFKLTLPDHYTIHLLE